MRDLFQLLETVAATSSTDPDHRRDRHRQGARRARDPPQQPAARRTVSSRSTAARFPRRCSRRSCSATCAARSPAPSATRQGRLEQAHKGTLFLDEVGTMSPALQMKLLRVLQEREFERVGDSHTIKVDVRVIAATNTRSARRWSPTDTFREDLFYRLNVIPVQLPPLRERRDDIPLLVQHFLQKLGERSGAAADDGVAGSDAPADGVSLAGQRPSARERRRAGGRVQSGPVADRRRRICRPRFSSSRSLRNRRKSGFPTTGSISSVHREQSSSR